MMISSLRIVDFHLELSGLECIPPPPPSDVHHICRPRGLLVRQCKAGGVCFAFNLDEFFTGAKKKTIIRSHSGQCCAPNKHESRGSGNENKPRRCTVHAPAPAPAPSSPSPLAAHGARASPSHPGLRGRGRGAGGRRGTRRERESRREDALLPTLSLLL